MEVKWTKQAYGFHQATYPCKSYNLSASLIDENMEQATDLGSVIVEEDGDGGLTFLFGSQLAFWPEIYKKLEEIELSPEQTAKIMASLAKKIPILPKIRNRCCS